MPFIGNQPAESYASFETETFSVSATTNYTLSHAVTNENEIRLVINGVVQQPGSGKAYTASGTTLTLSSATASGDSMYAVYLGRALQTVNPPNASVGNSQTAPTIITGQTAETSIATDDTILIHDTSASALRKMTRANFVSGVGGANTPSFLASLSANQTINNATYTKIQLDNEVLDTDNCYDNSTNYRFTPTTAGYYYLFASGRLDSGGGNTPHRHQIRKNNNSVSQIQAEWSSVTATQYIVSGLHYANGSSDYFEYFVRQDTGGNHAFNGGTWDSSGEIARFGAFKIIT